MGAQGGRKRPRDGAPRPGPSAWRGRGPPEAGAGAGGAREAAGGATQRTKKRKQEKAKEAEGRRRGEEERELPAPKAGGTKTTKKRRKKEKRAEERKGGDEGHGKKRELPAPPPAVLSPRPFATRAEDHCETPAEVSTCGRRAGRSGGLTKNTKAFRDVEPILYRLAKRLNKAKADLRIYDPFYCEGSMVAHLNALGFASVHNRNEDFYEVRRRGAVPEHDVLVTNPPFSGDHVERLLRWAREGNGGRPFLLLLPNFVATKGWFDGDVPWLFVVPAKEDYLFWAPGREGGRVRGRHILPKANGKEFPCFWFAFLGEHHAKVLHWWRKTGHRLHGHTVTVAETAAELPRGARAEKRPNPRQRAKARRKQQRQPGR